MIFLTHEFAPFRGGAGVYVQETAAAAARLGLPVEVWTVDYQGRREEDKGRRQKAEGRRVGGPCSSSAVDKQRETAASSALSTFCLLPSAFPVVRLRSSGRLSPAGIGALAWGIWRRRARLRGQTVYLLSVGAHLAFAALQVLGLLRDVRTVCFFHGSEVLKFQRGAWARGLVRRLYAKAAGFAVASRYVQRLVQESGLLPEGATIALAPCACPTALHPTELSSTPAGPTAADDADPDAAANAAAAASPSPTPPTAANRPNPPQQSKIENRKSKIASFFVLTVARLHPRKGQLELAQALARLPPEVRRRVVYQMVGAGEASYRAQVEQACRAGGVAGEFLGALDDAALRQVYARCDIYAQASRTLACSVEGFGISFLEASQHGKPIAAFETGGVAEAVLDQKTGLLVPEGDLAGLATAIARLAEDAALRERLGEGGREHAASFSWEASARVLHGFAQ